MTRKDLIEVVARKTDKPGTVCEEVIKATFKAITNELAGYGSVTIPKFGTFYVNEKKARAYVNPLNTEEATVVSARKYPNFRTVPALKEAVK